MKSTGIVRKVDQLGRIVLPIELRRNLDISEHDPLEIYVSEDTVILKKFQASCVLCGGQRGGLIDYRGKKVCGSCIKALKG